MQWKWTSPNKSKWRHTNPGGDLSRNESLQFSFASVRIQNKTKEEGKWAAVIQVIILLKTIYTQTYNMKHLGAITEYRPGTGRY